MTGRRPIKLPEVFVRPSTDGKRLPGEVEIHQNGLRYVSMGSQKIGEDSYLHCRVIFSMINFLDILFSNINSSLSRIRSVRTLSNHLNDTHQDDAKARSSALERRPSRKAEPDALSDEHTRVSHRRQ